jgi:hypothetical protein
MQFIFRFGDLSLQAESSRNALQKFSGLLWGNELAHERLECQAPKNVRGAIQCILPQMAEGPELFRLELAFVEIQIHGGVRDRRSLHRAR